MSINFEKSFDGLYGSNLPSPSFAPVAIQAGSYDPSFDSSQDADSKHQENQSSDEFNQYSLSQWYQEQNQSDQTPTQEQIQDLDDEMNFGSNSEALQIGIDTNLESEMDNNTSGLTNEQILKLQAFRYAPKINLEKVLRF